MQPNQVSQRLTPRPPHFLASSVALANFALISSAFYIGEALQLRIRDSEYFHSRASNLRATEAGTKAFCWFAPGGLTKASKRNEFLLLPETPVKDWFYLAKRLFVDMS